MDRLNIIKKSENSSILDGSITDTSVNDVYQTADEGSASSKYCSVIDDTILDITDIPENVTVDNDGSTKIHSNVTKINENESCEESINFFSNSESEVMIDYNAPNILSGDVNIFDENSADEPDLIIDDTVSSDVEIGSPRNDTGTQNTETRLESGLKIVSTFISSDESKNGDKFIVDEHSFTERNSVIPNICQLSKKTSVAQPLHTPKDNIIVTDDKPSITTSNDVVQTGDNGDVSNPTNEVILQIDGKNVDAIDVGNGLYLYRKEGTEELTSVQVIQNENGDPHFKFLKVRQNEEGNLEVYEEQILEVPESQTAPLEQIGVCDSDSNLKETKGNIRNANVSPPVKNQTGAQADNSINQKESEQTSNVLTPKIYNLKEEPLSKYSKESKPMAIMNKDSKTGDIIKSNFQSIKCPPVNSELTSQVVSQEKVKPILLEPNSGTNQFLSNSTTSQKQSKNSGDDDVKACESKLNHESTLVIESGQENNVCSDIKSNEQLFMKLSSVVVEDTKQQNTNVGTSHSITSDDNIMTGPVVNGNLEIDDGESDIERICDNTLKTSENINNILEKLSSTAITVDTTEHASYKMESINTINANNFTEIIPSSKSEMKIGLEVEDNLLGSCLINRNEVRKVTTDVNNILFCSTPKLESCSSFRAVESNQTNECTNIDISPVTKCPITLYEVNEPIINKEKTYNEARHEQSVPPEIVQCHNSNISSSSDNEDNNVVQKSKLEIKADNNAYSKCESLLKNELNISSNHKDSEPSMLNEECQSDKNALNTDTFIISTCPTFELVSSNKCEKRENLNEAEGDSELVNSADLLSSDTTVEIAEDEKGKVELDQLESKQTNYLDRVESVGLVELVNNQDFHNKNESSASVKISSEYNETKHINLHRDVKILKDDYVPDSSLLENTHVVSKLNLNLKDDLIEQSSPVNKETMSSEPGNISELNIVNIDNARLKSDILSNEARGVKVDDSKCSLESLLTHNNNQNDIEGDGDSLFSICDDHKLTGENLMNDHNIDGNVSVKDNSSTNLSELTKGRVGIVRLKEEVCKDNVISSDFSSESDHYFEIYKNDKVHNPDTTSTIKQKVLNKGDCEENNVKQNILNDLNRTQIQDLKHNSQVGDTFITNKGENLSTGHFKISNRDKGILVEQKQNDTVLNAENKYSIKPAVDSETIVNSSHNASKSEPNLGLDKTSGTIATDVEHGTSITGETFNFATSDKADIESKHLDCTELKYASYKFASNDDIHRKKRSDQTSNKIDNVLSSETASNHSCTLSKIPDQSQFNIDFVTTISNKELVDQRMSVNTSNLLNKDPSQQDKIIDQKYLSPINIESPVKLCIEDEMEDMHREIVTKPAGDNIHQSVSSSSKYLLENDSAVLKYTSDNSVKKKGIDSSISDLKSINVIVQTTSTQSIQNTTNKENKNEPMITESEFDKFVRRNSTHLFEECIVLDVRPGTNESKSASLMAMSPVTSTTKELMDTLSDELLNTRIEIQQSKGSKEVALHSLPPKKNYSANLPPRTYSKVDQHVLNQKRSGKELVSSLDNIKMDKQPLLDNSLKQVHMPPKFEIKQPSQNKLGSLVVATNITPLTCVILDSKDSGTVQISPSHEHSPSKASSLSPMVKSDASSINSSCLESDPNSSADESLTCESPLTKYKHPRKQILKPVIGSDTDIVFTNVIEEDKDDLEKSKVRRKKNIDKASLCNKKDINTNELKSKTSVKDILVDHSSSLNKEFKDSIFPKKKLLARVNSEAVLVEEIQHTKTDTKISVVGSQIEAAHVATVESKVTHKRGRPRKSQSDNSVIIKESPHIPNRIADDTKEQSSKENFAIDSELEEDELVKENWTMGKIDENIVCPICNKRFRSENVVFKHVKHCSGSNKEGPSQKRKSCSELDTSIKLLVSDNLEKNEVQGADSRSESGPIGPISSKFGNLSQKDVNKSNPKKSTLKDEEAVIPNKSIHRKEILETNTISTFSTEVVECSKAEEIIIDSGNNVLGNDNVINHPLKPSEEHKVHKKQQDNKDATIQVDEILNKKVPYETVNLSANLSQKFIDKSQILAKNNKVASNKERKNKLLQSDDDQSNIQNLPETRTTDCTLDANINTPISSKTSKNVVEKLIAKSDSLTQIKVSENAEIVSTIPLNTPDVIAKKDCDESVIIITPEVNKGVVETNDTPLPIPSHQKSPVKRKLNGRTNSVIPPKKKLATPMSRLSKILSTVPPTQMKLICEICGKSFRQLAYLVSHRLIHKSQSEAKSIPAAAAAIVHTCEVCHRTYRKLHLLVMHRQSHVKTTEKVEDKTVLLESKEKEIFDKTEGDSNKMNARKKSVENENATAGSCSIGGFRCEACGKSFRKLHHLVEHREIHDSPKSAGAQPPSYSAKDIIHECPNCYMVFPNEPSLNRHIQNICQRKKNQNKQIHSTNEEKPPVSVRKSADVEIVPLLPAKRASRGSCSSELNDQKSVTSMKQPKVPEENKAPTVMPIPDLSKDVVKVKPKSVKHNAIGDTNHDNIKYKLSDDDVVRYKLSPAFIKANKRLSMQTGSSNGSSKISKQINRKSESGISSVVPKKKEKEGLLKQKKLNEGMIVPKNKRKSVSDKINFEKHKDLIKDNLLTISKSQPDALLTSNVRKSCLDLTSKSKIRLSPRKQIAKIPVQASNKAKDKAEHCKVTDKIVDDVNLRGENKHSSHDDATIRYSFPKPIKPASNVVKVNRPARPSEKPSKPIGLQVKGTKIQLKSADTRISVAGAMKKKSVLVNKPKVEGRLVCLRCQEMFSSQAELNRHKNAKHKTGPAEASYRCDCGETFNSGTMLARHIRIAHTPPRGRRNTLVPEATAQPNIRREKSDMGRARIPHTGVPMSDKLKKVMSRVKF